MLLWYIDNSKVQIYRMENKYMTQLDDKTMQVDKRMVKVLKGLAEYLDISLGDLLEGIVLHAFAGKAPFSDLTLKQIALLKEIYGMDYGIEASHRLREIGAPPLEEH